MSIGFFFYVSGIVFLILYAILMLAGILSNRINRGKRFEGENRYLPWIAKGLTYALVPALVVGLAGVLTELTYASDECVRNLSILRLMFTAYGVIVCIGAFVALIVILGIRFLAICDYAYNGLKTLGCTEKKAPETDKN